MRKADDRHVRALLKEKGAGAFTEMALAYGKTFRHRGGIATCEPEVVRALLMERTHIEVRPAAHRMMRRLPGADGILFMDGEPWRQRLRAVTPVFQPRSVDAYAGSLREATVAHAARWHQASPLPDLYDAVQQLGVASILRMGYGLDPEDPRARDLGRALVDYKNYTMNNVTRLDDFAIPPSALFKVPAIIAGLVRMRRLMSKVERAVAGVRDAARGSREAPNWVAALDAVNVTDAQLAEELNHFYGAFNAVDYVVTMALYELAQRAELTARIRRELNAVVADGEAPSREQRAGLPLMNGFMLEVLRRYPVTMGAVRQTGSATAMGGEEVPKGTMVTILLQALHHHPDFWDEPEEFKPERWIGSPEPRVPFSYVPFLDGARKCIGQHMAEMQMLVVLAAVVRSFDVRVFGTAVIPPYLIPRLARPIPFALQACHPV